MSAAAKAGRRQDAPHSDAPLVFGNQGTKQIVPVFYRMAKTGVLDGPAALDRLLSD